MTFPRRGGFARDGRTGAYVRVTEESTGPDPDSSYWMVRPVYKDGYWVKGSDLKAAIRDPHARGWTDFAMFLVVLTAQGFMSWSLWGNTAGDLLSRILVTVLASLATFRTMLVWAGILRP